MKINSPRGKRGGGGEATGYEKLSSETGGRAEKKPQIAGGRRRIPLNFRSSPPKTGGVKSKTLLSPLSEEQSGADNASADYNGGKEKQKSEEKAPRKSGASKRKKLKKQLQFLQHLLKRQAARPSKRKNNEERNRLQITEEDDDDNDRLTNNKKIEAEDLSFSSDGRGKDRQSRIDDTVNNKAQAGWQAENIDGAAQAGSQNTPVQEARQSATLRVAARAFDAFFQNGNTPKLLHEGLSACIHNLKSEKTLPEKTVLAVSRSLLAIAKNLKAQNTTQDPQTDQARLNMMSGMAKTAKLLQNNPAMQKQELLPRLAYAALHVSEYAANRAAQGAT